MQGQQTPRRDPQGSTLVLRWLSQGTNFGGRRFKQPAVILCKCLGGTKSVNMEQEFEEIDSSGKWQNLYNVSRDTGPLVFL